MEHPMSYTTRDNDLPSYCQDTTAEEAYLERVLIPAIPQIAQAVANSIFDARTATRRVAPFERTVFLAKIIERLTLTPDLALEEVGLEYDLIPSFEDWSTPPQDDEDAQYDAYRERADR
jgi:hypothetical protein